MPPPPFLRLPLSIHGRFYGEEGKEKKGGEEEGRRRETGEGRGDEEEGRGEGGRQGKEEEMRKKGREREEGRSTSFI